MRTSLAGILAALAVPGLAGLAGADGGDDCLAGAAPLPGAHYAVCVLEENDLTYAFVACNPWGCTRYGGTYAANEPVAASAQVLGPGVATAWVEVRQSEGTEWYEGDGAWGPAHGTRSHDTTHVGVGQSAGSDVGASGGVAVTQSRYRAEDCSRWGCSTTDHEATAVGVSRQFGIAGGASVLYVQQSDHGGPCREHVAVGVFLVRLQTAEQPCLVEVPHLMDDPTTRFPDWPDGTGLPFL